VRVVGWEYSLHDWHSGLVSQSKKKVIMEKETAVKVALFSRVNGSITKKKEVVAIVEDVVKFMTLIMIVGTRVMNLYVLRIIEDCRIREEQERQNLQAGWQGNEEGLAAALTQLQVEQKGRQPNIRVCRTFANQVCKHSAPRDRSRATNDSIIQAYCHAYGVDNDDQVPKIVSDHNLVRIISLASEKYAVNVINHFTANFYGRVISCLRIVATRKCPKLNKGKKNIYGLNSAVSYTARLIIEGRNSLPGLTGEPPISEAVALAELSRRLQNSFGDDVETKGEVIRALWQYAVEALRRYGTADNVYRRLKNHTLYHWLYQLNFEIGNHNRYIENLRDLAEAERVAGRPFDDVRLLLKFEKKITMLPVANTNKAQHIQIDTQALFYLFRGVYNFPGNWNNDYLGADNAQDRAGLWRKVFNFRGIRKDGDWTRTHYITTDATCINVHFRRDMTAGEAAAARAAADAAKARPYRNRSRNTVPPDDVSLFPEFHTFHKDRVVGLDPGGKENVTAVGMAPDVQDNPRPKYQPPSRKAKACNKDKKKPDGHRESRNGNRRKHKHGGRKKQKCNNKGERLFQFSNRHWTHVTGSKQAAKSSSQRLAKTPVYYVDDGNEYETTLYDVKVTITTAKVVTSQEFLHHCEHVFFFLEDIVNDLMVPKVRRERFGRYMKRQATLDMVCHGITFGMNDAIVVFGNCTGQKRYFPFPTKELIRHLQHYKDTTVIIFDEFRTSKCCSKCAFNQDLKERRGDKMCGENKEGGRRNEFPIYGVRVCKHCRVRWNRDINAARNMRLIFLYMVENRIWQPGNIPVRPFPFSRLAQEAALAQERAAALAQAQAEAH